MGSRIIKSKEKAVRPKGSGTQITGQILEYLLAVVVVILCVAVSFYTTDGYHGIGNAKFAAYQTVLRYGGVFLLAAMVPYLIFFLIEHRKPRLSVTDVFVLAYLVLSGISVISGGFWHKNLKGILQGYKGWNMGLFSQISFVLLYLFLSRFGRYYRLILTVLCGSAVVVYGIGILHRLLIDPIGFYDDLNFAQKAQFLSTLGQASWYGSFLAVTLPVGIGVFLHTDKWGWWIAGGVYTTLGFCTLVTQNSDSAYAALAGALLLLLMSAAPKRETMCRFMGVLTIFFASGKVMGYLVRLRPNPELQADFVTKLMWDSRLTWVAMNICLLAMAVLIVMGVKNWRYPTVLMRWVSRIVLAAAVLTVLGVILVICLQVRGALPQAVSEKLAGISYLNWNDGWGNGRGRIWRFSAKLFAEEKMGHKLLGIGPDCFHSYVAANYSEEAELLWGSKQLTNAHNEWLNMLINGGIFGVAAYLGIYVTAVGRLMRTRTRNVLAAGIAAAVVSYMCYNFFCYQQVLCTPFVFICMGIGEYILQNED